MLGSGDAWNAAPARGLELEVGAIPVSDEEEEEADTDPEPGAAVADAAAEEASTPPIPPPPAPPPPPPRCRAGVVSGDEACPDEKTRLGSLK